MSTSSRRRVTEARSPRDDRVRPVARGRRHRSPMAATHIKALVMRRALTYARDFGATIVHETQDADLGSSGVMNEGLYASWLGLSGIPREAESIPLERDLALARLTRGSYHAAKISTAMAANAVTRAKADGADVTSGVSIHNLSLNENDVGQYRTFFRLTPPLRAEEDRLAMIEALREARSTPSSPRNPGCRYQAPALRRAGGASGWNIAWRRLALYHNSDVPLLGCRNVSTAPASCSVARRHAEARCVADLALVDLADLDHQRGIRSRSKTHVSGAPAR